MSRKNLERDLAQSGATKRRMQVIESKLVIDAKGTRHLTQQVLFASGLLFQLVDERPKAIELLTTVCNTRAHRTVFTS
jgi:hypothetical protein